MECVRHRVPTTSASVPRGSPAHNVKWPTHANQTHAMATSANLVLRRDTFASVEQDRLAKTVKRSTNAKLRSPAKMQGSAQHRKQVPDSHAAVKANGLVIHVQIASVQEEQSAMLAVSASARAIKCSSMASASLVR